MAENQPPSFGERLWKRLRQPRPVVAVLQLSGIIGRMGPGRRGLTASGLTGTIERAFSLRRLKAVALAINSPGGSPVQSALIADRIRQFAAEKDVPVHAFIEDVGASGGYWLALAGDDVYAHPSSVVGSIGVISGGFGFVDTIKKLGMERRLHTSGDRKAMLDPFSPETADDVKHLKSLQADIHETFKDWVRTRRGDKLTAPEDEVFSGAFWTGNRAKQMGLVDDLAEMRGHLRARYGEDVKLKLMMPRKGFFARRFGGRMMGAGLAGPDGWADDVLAAVEERLWWGRFGL